MWQDGDDARARLWRWRRAAGAGRAVADQPRLYPRSRARAEPAALSRRRGAAAAAGRLGRARAGGARLRLADYIAGRLEPRRPRSAAAAGRASPCWAIAWAGCWRWRSAGAPARPGHVPGAAGDALGLPCRARRPGAAAGRARRAARRAATRVARRGAGRCAADAVRRRSTRCWRCANSRASPRWRQEQAEARDFVALEDWLNDGVPLALPVARECLGGWYGDNVPGRGQLARLPAGRCCRAGRRGRAWSWCRRRTASCRPRPPRRWPSSAAAERWRRRSGISA